MSTPHYHLRLKPGYKLSDEEQIRRSIKEVRRILAGTEVIKKIVGFFHCFGATAYVDAHSNPYSILEQLVETKGRVGSTCPKLHHTTVGP